MESIPFIVFLLLGIVVAIGFIYLVVKLINRPKLTIIEEEEDDNEFEQMDHLVQLSEELLEKASINRKR